MPSNLSEIQRLALAKLTEACATGEHAGSAMYQLRGKMLLGDEDVRRVRIAFEADRVRDLEGRADRELGIELDVRKLFQAVGS